MTAAFVHGVPDTHRLWDDVIARLSRTDAVAVSLPGFGCGVPNGFDATKEAYAAWLCHRLESFGGSVDLVGHDWGSLLVQRVVSVRPDLVRTWACGAGAVDRDYEWHPVAKLWQTPGVGEQAMEAMTPETLAAALVAAGVPEDAAHEAAARCDDLMKRCILSLYRSAVEVGAEWQQEVEGVRAPGLVIWGADDPYSGPAYAERLAERVGAELLVLEGCGHWWPVERPVEVADALELFWAR